MTNCWFGPTFIELWLHGLTIYERQRALALRFHLELLAALATQQTHKREASNVVPFRRPVSDQAVVLELR